jgi:hypothetical protein
MVGLIEGAVAEHREEDVAASSGESDEGLVVAFALGYRAVVIGAGDRVAQRRERGEEQRPFEELVASPMRDACPGSRSPNDA